MWDSKIHFFAISTLLFFPIPDFNKVFFHLYLTFVANGIMCGKGNKAHPFIPETIPNNRIPTSDLMYRRPTLSQLFSYNMFI